MALTIREGPLTASPAAKKFGSGGHEVFIDDDLPLDRFLFPILPAKSGVRHVKIRVPESPDRF
jgi:hypothetical protein